MYGYDAGAVGDDVDGAGYVSVSGRIGDGSVWEVEDTLVEA